jgi:hypothetical protein
VASDTNQPRRGPSDATDYSSTKAPETQAAAENRTDDPVDPRLHPGGAHGSPADPGMSSLDEEAMPSDPHRKP